MATEIKLVRVLIGCEFSGVVRDAFSDLGCYSVSCDLLPSEKPGAHIQQSISEVLHILGKWDLIVAHPPCTYLCNSGVRWLSPGGKLNPERHKLMVEACDFFAALYHADCPHVAIENPVMHKYAREYLWSVHKVPSYSFSIQPWQHGEPEVKRTCFWTLGLPDIVPSNIVAGRAPRVHHASPGPNRWKERSRTLPGVAKSLAKQWTAALRLDKSYEP